MPRYASGVGMYEPRPVLLQATKVFSVAPPASVKSPRAPGRTANTGRSGARPLATMCRPFAKIGVGAVIFELPPRCHSSRPVLGSYPRTKFDAFVISSGPALVFTIVGVPHDGSSCRSVFQTVAPVSALSASRNESVCVSHCTITRPFQTIGELAGPHSYDGRS